MLQSHSSLGLIHVVDGTIPEKIRYRRLNIIDVPMLNSDSNQRGDDALGAGMNDVFRALPVRVSGCIQDESPIPNHRHAIYVVILELDLFKHSR
jgi:hypothetical protein